ncbi:MAG TPA: bifunctional (p)ppGpp synthetase/guanosine-3',5'-bis(diphosphate) 3'-pyrophosphohydrolase [Clostridiales bacterium]|nr:bifunctional (p)ppGpp synthetase/guanosine-3',5'-bis(diphosphate) 3'-pyrophosphohydrolase [Clostridiales bacterium]
MENFDVEGLYSKFKESAEKQFQKEEVAEIEKAFRTAEAAHADQKRSSGEPYIIHPIAVASILLSLGMDYQSIVAALLHDTVEDTSISLSEVQALFGSEIAALVDGVTKLEKVPLHTKEEQQAENIRKMLLAMSEDIRVIIVKLADRLHNIRTLNYVDEQKRRDKALETLEIYAPIAHRLGIRALKEELEDRAISFLDPVAYKEIEQSLSSQNQVHKDFLEKTRHVVSDRVKDVVKSAQIEGRLKSVHGIYRKMYMQNRDFDEIYDIYAIRIIVDNVIECYDCLGIIHDMFRPILGRFKDYISTPKPNMYQSLHTTVIGKEGIPFEVQIRTREMHITAEYGIAAHWKYKLGLGGTDRFEERLKWIRQLLDSQQDADDIEDIVRTIKSELVPDEVFVFTPKGDVVNLPSGATVIDFAYAIHSAVGHKMVGAKVNGRIVPIDYQVETGEIVEVLTSSQQGKGPGRDWLNIVKTSEARSKIRNWFKREKREENIIEGKQQIERELRRNKLRFTDEQFSELLDKLVERQRCNNTEDFFAAIGYGGIPITRIMPFVREEYHRIVTTAEGSAIPPTATREKFIATSEGVIVEGINNCLVKLSRCCNPIPGDSIIGFITRGHGVSVHKRDCANVPDNIELSAEPDRWIRVYWDKAIKESFRASLSVLCISRVALMADISGLLANMRVFINSVNTRENRDGTLIIYMTITVNSVEHLTGVTQRMEKIDGVISVERSKT